MLGKTLMLGQEEKGVTGDKVVDGITDAADMNFSKLWETVKDREARCATVHGVSELDTS